MLDDIIGLIIEFIGEMISGTAENKNNPKGIRIAAVAILVLVAIAVWVVCLVDAVKDGATVGIVIFSVLIVATVAFMFFSIISILRK